MTQEDKNLLLQDLCSRLPYKVKVDLTYWRNRDKGIMASKVYEFPLNINNANVLISETTDVKPYLFPLSSMTEEQEKECQQIKHSYYYDDDSFVLFDWYNKNHFDYRGLIPMGLAIDATRLNVYCIVG